MKLLTVAVAMFKRHIDVEKKTVENEDGVTVSKICFTLSTEASVAVGIVGTLATLLLTYVGIILPL